MHGGLLVGSILTTTASTSCPRGNALTSKRGNGVTPELTRELIHVPGSSLGSRRSRGAFPLCADYQVAADRIRRSRTQPLRPNHAERDAFPFASQVSPSSPASARNLSTALASLPRLIGAERDPDSLCYVLLADALVTA